MKLKSWLVALLGFFPMASACGVPPPRVSGDSVAGSVVSVGSSSSVAGFANNLTQFLIIFVFVLISIYFMDKIRKEGNKKRKK